MNTERPEAALEGDTGIIELYHFESQARKMAAIIRNEDPNCRITVKPTSIRASGVTVRRFALVIHW